MAGVRINIHVRSGSMEACSNDARKQLTTRTLAKGKKILHPLDQLGILTRILVRKGKSTQAYACWTSATSG